jgi:hypothetical protein
MREEMCLDGTGNARILVLIVLVGANRFRLPVHQSHSFNDAQVLGAHA